METLIFSQKIEKYAVWQIDCEAKSGADKIKIVKPDETSCILDFFYNIPVEFVYDVHGYETLDTKGTTLFSARFCPDAVGKHLFYVYKKDELLYKGEFYCIDSNHHGYIKVSEKDKRYFKFTDNTPYIPIGINMVYPMSYLRSDGTEFGITSNSDTLGIRCYEKWIKKFAKYGGNYLRIWLGHEYFNIDSDVAGVIKYEQFAKIDKIVELAKKYGIKLKFTIEQFRHIGDKTNLFTKKIRLTDGKTCLSAEEWLTAEVWQNHWKQKVKEYLKRYSNEPTVAVWELWNEMLCFDSTPEKITEWTANTVRFIKENAPNQLVTTSFGSLNSCSGEKWYNAHFLDELDFLQIHRYLDQGEKEKLRRTEPFLNTTQAIKDISTNTRPAILAETGAVNNNHSGPFRYYLSDDRGIIFADTVYPAFFACSAGCGQIWHWDDRYVSAKGLFKMYKPFAELVNNVNPELEEFCHEDYSNEKVYCCILKGKNITLGLIRNRSDSWQNVLRDNNDAQTIDSITINFNNYSQFECKIIKIWEDDTTEIEATENSLQFSNLKYGTFFYLKRN